MTISSSTRKAGPFTGNGVTTAFPFSFKVFSTADVLVVQALTSTGAETVQTLTTNYTVALNADQNVSPGGTVTMLVAPPTGYTLTLTSQVDNLQAVDVTNGGGFYPKVLNNAFDKATIQIQQLAEKVGRALKLPVSSTASADLPAPVGGAGIGWDASGTALVNFVLQAGTSLVNLAASGGAALIGYLPAGGAATTVQSKLRKFATDSTSGDSSDATAAATISVNQTRTTINKHAFEDWSTLNTSDTNLGYCSFDAQPTMTNSLPQNHFVGYQSRPIYNGSANLTSYWHGYNVSLQHFGTGIVASAVGVSIADVSGTGPVTENIGIFIADMVRGSAGNNWAIYSTGGKVHFGGPVELSQGSTNHTLKQSVAWSWTSTGDSSGTIRGGIYASAANAVSIWGGTNPAVSALGIGVSSVSVVGSFDVSAASTLHGVSNASGNILTADGTTIGWGAGTTALIGTSSGSDLGMYAGGVNTASLTATQLIVKKTLKITPLTVATLPAAATAGAGTRTFVTDANATMTAGIGAVVAAGGANTVPVYSDGTNWRIG